MSADVGRGDRRAQLSRRACSGCRGARRPRSSATSLAAAEGLGRRPLCAGEGQGPHRRISRGPGADQQAQGADPVPRRSRRASARPRSAAAIAKATGREFIRQSLGGDARRGRDPRPPPDVHRLDAGQGRSPNLKKAGTSNPLVPARRDRQARPGFPRRPVVGAARGARSRAEQAKFNDHYLEIDLRPVRRHVRVHGQQPQHAAAAARPDGDHPASKAIPRTRRCEIAKAHLLPTSSIEAHGLKPAEFALTDGGLTRPDPLLHPRGRACGRSSASWRKLARKVAAAHPREARRRPITIDETTTSPSSPGVRKYQVTASAEVEDQIGAVTGLAWTEVGGELLTIEAVTVARQGHGQDHRQARRRDDRERSPGGAVVRQGAERSPMASSPSVFEKQGHPRPSSPKARRRRTARRPASAWSPRSSRP